MRSVSSKERERDGEEEARRELEEEERRRQEEEKKLEGEEEEEEVEEKKRKYREEEEEGEEEEGRSLGSESYTTAASSLSYNVCKICHCGGEVKIIIMGMIVNPSLRLPLIISLTDLINDPAMIQQSRPYHHPNIFFTPSSHITQSFHQIKILSPSFRRMNQLLSHPVGVLIIIIVIIVIIIVFIIIFIEIMIIIVTRRVSQLLSLLASVAEASSLFTRCFNTNPPPSLLIDQVMVIF